MLVLKPYLSEYDHWPTSGRAVAGLDPLRGYLNGEKAVNRHPVLQPTHENKLWIVLEVDPKYVVSQNDTMVSFTEGEVVHYGDQYSATNYLLKTLPPRNPPYAITGAIITPTETVATTGDRGIVVLQNGCPAKTGNESVVCGISNSSMDTGRDTLISACDHNTIRTGSRTALHVGDLNAIITGESCVIKAGSENTLDVKDSSLIQANHDNRIKAEFHAIIDVNSNNNITVADHATIRTGGTNVITAGTSAMIKCYQNSTVVTGEDSLVQAGATCKVSAGNHGIVIAKDLSDVIVGNSGLALAGKSSTVQAGEHGVLILSYRDPISKITRYVLGNIGLDKDCCGHILKPNVQYQLDLVTYQFRRVGVPIEPAAPNLVVYPEKPVYTPPSITVHTMYDDNDILDSWGIPVDVIAETEEERTAKRHYAAELERWTVECQLMDISYEMAYGQYVEEHKNFKLLMTQWEANLASSD